MTKIQNYIAVAMDAIAENSGKLPTDLFAVGGYVNGAITRFVWSDQQWARFPQSYHIRINVNGDPNRGNCLDIENGDATVSDVIPWINRRSLTAKDPLLLYCNRSNLDAVIGARNKANRFAWIWCATLDETLMTGHAATQIDQIKIGGITVADMSIILSPKLRTLMAARIGKQ